MLDKGARITDVSELLGHEFISTTQIYTKLSNSLKLKNYLKAHPLCS
jgi:integrase/recombinase XerC